MSDSSEPETSVQESQPAEQESQPAEQESISQQGDMANNIKKRTLDADDDEDPQNASSKLENLKKVAKKPTARRIQFERTEEEALGEEGDALPIACSICREPFLDPIVTRCKHYFCKQCALKHHEKNVNCFVCDKATLGVFNTAVEIKKKIAQVREKAQAMVKEVSTTVEKAAVLVKNAEAMSAESARIVEEVETMVGIVAAYGPEAAADADPSSWDSVIRLVENVEVVAANAREMAEKAADMMQEANAKTETARAEMAKALVVMKNVKWNV